MGLIGAVSTAFDALRQVYECLPVAVRLLLLGTAGVFLLFGIFKLFLN